MYNSECEICKLKNACNAKCKHRQACKLYTIVNDEGNDAVTIQRVHVNARLPVQGTSGAAGYDMSTAQSAIVPAHGKCLVKTGVKMALPTGCYGRIAPRSGLAIKKYINIGAGVIDADYRGEVGAILFNFSDEDFVVNQGDRIAQIIFEKIKDPRNKRVSQFGRHRPRGMWIWQHWCEGCYKE